MADILKTNQAILNGLLYLNIIFFLVSLFYISKISILSFFVINIILIATHLIIKKNYFLLQGLVSTNKLFKNLNNMAAT
jgi:hypothetical protein